MANHPHDKTTSAHHADPKPAAASPAPKAKSSPTPASPTSPGTVHITSSGFSPATLEAAVGDTVVFENADATVHTVTFDAAPITSGDISPAATFRHTVTAAGDHAYHCDKHPEMRGVLKVS